jgi:hypothetical protein
MSTMEKKSTLMEMYNSYLSFTNQNSGLHYSKQEFLMGLCEKGIDMNKGIYEPDLEDIYQYILALRDAQLSPAQHVSTDSFLNDFMEKHTAYDLGCSYTLKKTTVDTMVNAVAVDTMENAVAKRNAKKMRE